MFRPAVLVSIISLIYSWTYIYASLFPQVWIIESEYVKFLANIIFAILAIYLALRSRGNTSVSQSDNEINFAIAFAPLVIAVVDPLANLLKSPSGKNFVIEHWMGMTAFGWGMLCGLVLLTVVIVGLRLSKKRVPHNNDN